MDPTQPQQPTSPAEQPTIQPQQPTPPADVYTQPPVATVQPVTEQPQAPTPPQDVPVVTAPQPMVTQQVQAPPTAPTGMPYQPAPTVSAPTGFPTMSAMGANNSKKKFITIGAGIAGVAILLVGIVIGYKSLFSVSKDDYRKASSTISTAETKLSDVNIALIGLNYTSSLTETKINNNVDTLKKAVAEYEDAVKKLSGEKAVKSSSISKQYKAFKELDDKYTPLVKAYATDAQKLLVPMAKCDDTIDSAASTTTAGISSMGSCLTQLSSVKDLTDSDLKSLLDTMISSYKEIKSILEQLNSTPLDEYTTRSQLRTRYYDAEEALNKRISDIDSNINKKFKDSDPSDELRTLSDSVFSALLKK